MKYTLETVCYSNDSNTLRDILLKNKNDNVSRYAARNTNCPSDALEFVLLQNKSDMVSWSAAENPNCPSNALEFVLLQNKDDIVSWNAARNPNCPNKAVLDWMRATGRIDKFDPSKHKSDYKPDKDLEILKKMII